MQIFRQNPRTDADAVFEHPHLSGPPPQGCVALPSHAGWWHRDVQILEFFPTSRPSSYVCILQSRPKNLNLHLPKNTFRRTFHPCTSQHQLFSLVVTSQSSDRASLKWLRQWYTVYDFVFHDKKEDRWQDRQHTDWRWRAVSEDTRIIRCWLLHDAASIGRVTIPSNCADRPTLDQTLT